MAADQERADRIRALKQERPDLTWRRIADYVGVTERSATDWQKKGGIDYDNAKKLAELFEVDTDYIWRGLSDDERAPSPFASRDATEDRLERMEQQLAAHAKAVEELLKQQNELLARQSLILERIEAAVDAEEHAARRLAENPTEWAREVLALVAAHPPDAESDAPAPSARKSSRTRQG